MAIFFDQLIKESKKYEKSKIPSTAFKSTWPLRTLMCNTTIVKLQVPVLKTVACSTKLNFDDAFKTTRTTPKLRGMVSIAIDYKSY